MIQRCTQLCEPEGTPCQSPAEYSYVWPDGGDHRACSAHVRTVLRIAEALGVRVKLHRIALETAKTAVLRASVFLWSRIPEHDAEDIRKFSAAVEALLLEEERTNDAKADEVERRAAGEEPNR